MRIIILYWAPTVHVNFGQESFSILFENGNKKAEYISNWPIHDESLELFYNKNCKREINIEIS